MITVIRRSAITMTEIPALQIIDILSKKHPYIDFPETFIDFLKRQEQQGHRLTRIDSGQPLAEFLQKLGVKQSKWASFLNNESKLTHKIDYHALITLSPEEVYHYLIDRYVDIFDLQTIVLDSELKTGFNRHGKNHLTLVTQRSLQLLRELRLDIVSSEHNLEYETIIGGILHDVGNLLSRQYHGLYGIYLLTQLCTNYACTDSTLESFLTVLETVLFHEVEYGSRLPTLALLSPATLSVIIADKTDISFKRLSSKSNVEEAMQDAHILVNLLVSSSSVQRLPGIPVRFQWTIDFKSKYDIQQLDIFSSLLKVTGRVNYPENWQMLYQEGNIEYLFVFNSTFLRVYLSRIYFAIRAVFAMYPSVEEFLLVIDDAERGISLTRRFSRDDFLVKIVTLGKLFYKGDWANSYLYTAIQAQSGGK